MAGHDQAFNFSLRFALPQTKDFACESTPGPVCVSFSLMGKKLGEQDSRFECHEKYYENMKPRCDILLIENVPRYKTELIQRKLGSLWSLKSVVIDPRIFGVPAARSRVYGIAFKKSKVRWRSDVVFEDVLDALTCQVISDASIFWWDSELPQSTLTEAAAL